MNQPPTTALTALYASVGRVLTHYAIDIDQAALTPRAALTLPFKVQYVWPHPAAPYLYAACSNGSPDARGDAHCVVALRVDTTGALSLHGAAVPLKARPIHITLDATGSHALIAYNNPSSLTVHRIAADGLIGAEVAPRAPLDMGIYAHQVRVAPSNKAVTVVARGNNANDAQPEDPGALKVFAYDEGQLTLSVSVAPHAGYGFGPRHIDFHPTQPWVYASLERQNLLQFYRANHAGDTVEAAPTCSVPTLAADPGARPRQRCGTVHVHPNGRFVYVANRASGVAPQGDEALYIGGENNIAVYQIDAQSGVPTASQHADTHGIVPRTFALDKTGRVLVAANSVPIRAREGNAVVTICPSLAVFRVREDGKLDYVRKYDIAVGEDTLFWMGIVG